MGREDTRRSRPWLVHGERPRLADEQGSPQPYHSCRAVLVQGCAHGGVIRCTEEASSSLSATTASINTWQGTCGASLGRVWDWFTVCTSPAALQVVLAPRPSL